MSPLQTLLQHAQGQRDAALAKLARAEKQARQLQAQSQQLLAYRDDYRRRDPAQVGRSATIDLLQHHRAFMQRLQQAVEQQQAQADAAQSQIEQLRRALLLLEQRVASVGKLLQRRDQAAQTQHDRRDQRQADEAAQQRFQRERALAQNDPLAQTA